MKKQRTAIFISGRGSNMLSLIEACRAEEFPAQIDLVLSDRDDAPGLGAARRHGIEALALDTPAESFELGALALLKNRGIKIVCLAGFMRILSPSFLEAIHPLPILNIHPSLLPAFKGLRTHERVIASRTRKHGATVHLVTAKLDDGPILCQQSLVVEENETVENLAKRVLGIEHKIYPQALRQMAERLGTP